MNTNASQQHQLQSSDWLVDKAKKTALHKSGLLIHLTVANYNTKKTPSLDIQGLEKVARTEWATRTNVLIEQGILLLEN